MGLEHSHWLPSLSLFWHPLLNNSTLIFPKETTIFKLAQCPFLEKVSRTRSQSLVPSPSCNLVHQPGVPAPCPIFGTLRVPFRLHLLLAPHISCFALPLPQSPSRIHRSIRSFHQVLVILLAMQSTVSKHPGAGTSTKPLSHEGQSCAACLPTQVGTGGLGHTHSCFAHGPSPSGWMCLSVGSRKFVSA